MRESSETKQLHQSPLQTLAEGDVLVVRVDDVAAVVLHGQGMQHGVLRGARFVQWIHRLVEQAAATRTMTDKSNDYDHDDNDINNTNEDEQE